MSISRQEERAVRDIGRRALEKAAAAGSDKQSQGVSRMFATVTRVNGDGTLDVDSGSAAHPQQMLGLRMTSACYGVRAGNRVVVDTYAHVSVVTGILASSDSEPYVTSAANVMSTAQVVAPVGAKYAHAPLTLLERTSTPPVSVGSDGTSFRVARAGLYLVSVKALCFNVAAGDICHASVLMDGQEQPRVNVQQNVNGTWSMLAGSEVVRLAPSQVLRLGYACEQGGGSAMQSSATVGVVYLGA